MHNWEGKWELGVGSFCVSVFLCFFSSTAYLHCIDTSMAYPRISFKFVLAFL